MQYYLNYIASNNIFSLNDNETDYECIVGYKCKGNSHLHKIVINTKKHKILEKYLKLYLETEKGKKELNLKNEEGYTPLMLASMNSNTTSTLKTIKILIKFGANLDLQDNRGFTALIFACERGPNGLKTIEMLIEAGANIELQIHTGSRVLELVCYYSIRNNTLEIVEIVKILIKAKANLDWQDKRGNFPLMTTCRYTINQRTFEIMKILIKEGANLNLQDIDGNTALMVACFCLNVSSILETVKILIEAGANLDLQNIFGETALIIVCKYQTTNILETVKILIEAGANLDLQNIFGETALIMVCKYQTTNILETVKILIEAGANLDLRDNSGYTALTWLLQNKNINVNNIHKYLEYYKNTDKNKLQQYIKNNKIPIDIYDFLIVNKIILPIKSEQYSKSKYHIKISLDLRILYTYQITESKCIICFETTKTITCNHNHSTCFRCLYSLNYKCHGCQTEL